MFYCTRGRFKSHRSGVSRISLRARSILVTVCTCSCSSCIILVLCAVLCCFSTSNSSVRYAVAIFYQLWLLWLEGNGRNFHFWESLDYYIICTFFGAGFFGCLLCVVVKNLTNPDPAALDRVSLAGVVLVNKIGLQAFHRNLHGQHLFVGRAVACADSLPSILKMR